MQHIYSFEEARLDRPSIVTVGMFDGVHRGHQFLVKRLVEAARVSSHASIVLTFFPHPDVVIRGIQGPYYLTTPEERARLLEPLGLDLMITHPFDENVRHIRAADFADRLVNYLRMSTLWATADFAMGYKREGTIAYLTEQGREKGFSVETVDLLLANPSGERISSANIRAALSRGDIAAAAESLGRPYRLGGEVVHGERRGRKIGFPTANIHVWEAQVIPQNGVYACRAHLGVETFKAVTNVGNRPTFNGQSVTVEAHLLDFDRDIYGQRLDLDFVAHLRGEVKFSGIEGLVAQIRQDVERGRAILQE
jgi:riboflavin kinase/FMN adenylyltransferase